MEGMTDMIAKSVGFPMKLGRCGLMIIFIFFVAWGMYSSLSQFPCTSQLFPIVRQLPIWKVKAMMRFLRDTWSQPTATIHSEETLFRIQKLTPSFGLLATDDCSVVGIRAHNLQTLGLSLFCRTNWELCSTHFRVFPHLNQIISSLTALSLNVCLRAGKTEGTGYYRTSAGEPER